MDELESPKEVREQALNYLEQQVQEYHEASALLRNALDNPRSTSLSGTCS
jgi:hypothetical protein